MLFRSIGSGRFRKVLAETAAADEAQFGLIIEQVKTALAAAPAK